ncbi:hypothetical protein HYW84_02685 [Candidatus Peregrinibacteria bacterium]|nr:hypothetical protein [Candidatus Peregrinibacteria bacterium]
MAFIRLLYGILLPRAGATALEQLGSGAPGIADMWMDLKSIFPHTDLGSQGLTFIVLMFTNIILRFIGGVAVIMIMYGGVRMIMTVADENAHGEAKKVVMYSCLGLILAIGADGIVMYVMRMVQLAAGG